VGLMSRVRWLLAGALALVAFAASIQALGTYLAQHMTVGVLAVGALAVTLAVGLGSLGWARLRIERELRGLRSTPGAGELLGHRRKRLEAIKAAGARPDREALADSTAAEEAGRAYIGRYLVATTVLMGLVGTFAGLMETLGKIAPLLGDKQSDALSLLAAPLAGLHVTFGASLVAILATLALALAQGDLALHEEQALALLEDRTTHELTPKLWPPAEEAAERTARAVAELKTTLAEALVRALEKTGKQMAESARAESERAARTLESTATRVSDELARLGATLSSAADETARRQSAALAEAGATVTKAAHAASEQATARATRISEELARLGATLTTTAEETARRQSAALAEAGATVTKAAHAASEQATARATAMVEEAVHRSAALGDEARERTIRATEEAARATTAVLSNTLEPLFAAEAGRLEAVRATLAEVAKGIEAAVARLGALDAGMAGLSRDHLATIDRAGTAVLASFDRAVLGGAAALDGAAGSLATAAKDLQSGADAFAPRIAALTTELGALGREVALLAARDPESELDAVVLGELERLGAGIDRLVELSRLGQPVETLAPPASTVEES
jgi:chemotaxis protein histidine kinase CheA